jgi:hypothetical protein
VIVLVLPLRVCEVLISIICLILADVNLLQEQLCSNDMVRLINQHLERLNMESEESSINKVNSQPQGLDGNNDVIGQTVDAIKRLNDANTGSISSVGLPIPQNYREWERHSEATTTSAALNRVGSVSSSATSSMRLVDEELFKEWQPVENNWAPPEANHVIPARRATFDDSDLGRYRRRPAWKCKHCEGVGWTELEPCDGCGRYLPENFQVHRPRPPMREGDWICSCCNNMNWEWRTQCNRCHTCRDVERAPVVGDASPASIAGGVDDIVKQRLKKRLSTHPAGVFKDNDWVCVCCGNINWDWRVKCHQCGTGKPTTTLAGAASLPNSRQSMLR